MKAKTREFMVDVLGIDEEYLEQKTYLEEELGYDVFDMNDMFNLIEEEYGCWFKLSDKERIKTVQDVIAFIEKYEEEEAEKWSYDEEDEDEEEEEEYEEDEEYEDEYDDYDDDDDGEDW